MKKNLYIGIVVYQEKTILTNIPDLIVAENESEALGKLVNSFSKNYIGMDIIKASVLKQNRYALLERLFELGFSEAELDVLRHE